MKEFLNIEGEKMELSKEKIINSCRPFEPLVCIYFLIKNEEIVYVGKTTNLHYRLSQHYKDKDFDSYTFLPCSEEELNDLEFKYVVKFDPILNVMLPDNPYYRSLDYIKRKSGIKKPTLKKMIKEQGIKPIFREFYDMREFDFNE